ncbi:hypothetical protein BH18ACI5_BH18ACI5_09480 [soil metagenome]
MKRREFVEKLGIGSVGIAAAAAIGRGTGVSAQNQHAHDPFQIDGPLASATVTFGQWLTTPVLDRFTGVSSTRLSNQHKMIPYDVTIKAGGAVTFIIAGTHLVLIYAPGTALDSIDKTLLEGVTATFPGFVNDPANRIYRGPDPRPLPLDRVEVVTFAEPGRYLVVCGVIAHLNTDMYGYVTVRR